MKAIQIHQPGDVDALQYEELSLPEPGPGEVRVKLEAAGVNFIDTYHRRGQYDQPLPFTPGMEGAGIVDAVGAEVTAVAPGDRVAYAMHIGAYAEYALVPAWRLVQVPDELALATAAAIMLQGLTAHYLTHSTYPIQRGDTVLVHAAAGGMGLLLVQLARLRGARVIGTASTPEKMELARKFGAADMINYTKDAFSPAVQELTDGDGVHAVYDGVGKTTFLPGLDCLRPRGFMVLFGQAGGPVDPIDPQLLNRNGSLFLTRPSLAHYTRSATEIQQRAGDLFSWMRAGELQVRIDRTLPLNAAADAHRYIESRQSKGKVLLLPQHLQQAETIANTINQTNRLDERSWESFPASDPPPH